MKKNLKIFLLMLALILSFSFVSCGNVNENSKTQDTQKEVKEDKATEKTESTGSFKIIDKANRELSFEKTPGTIIALNPSDAEILDSIGQTDKLIAIGKYVDYPESILNLPKLDTGKNLNIEEIINLNPDVVFMTDMATNEESVKKLEDAGINIVMTSAKSIDDTYDSIKLISEVLKTEEAGEKVIENMKSEFENLSKNKSDNEGKTIYFEISPIEYGLWTAGSDTFMDDIANILGASNIFHDVKEFSEISEEEVISRNPDYIVVTSMGDSEDIINEILNRKGWEDITAIKNKNIFHSYDSTMTRPSPRLVDGAKDMQDLLNK